MKTRLLSKAEFRDAFRGKMQDISQREDDVQPNGVLDLRPYVRSIPKDDLSGNALLGDDIVSSAYRSEDGAFDHVLFPCRKDNIFLVVVVDLVRDRPHGHHLLNLREEYGLER